MKTKIRISSVIFLVIFFSVSGLFAQNKPKVNKEDQQLIQKNTDNILLCECSKIMNDSGILKTDNNFTDNEKNIGKILEYTTDDNNRSKIVYRCVATVQKDNKSSDSEEYQDPMDFDETP